MRWLLTVLVLANILACLYHLNRESAAVVTNVSNPVSVGEDKLRLLSEAKPQARRNLPDVVSDSCIFLGGFDDEAVALAVRQRLLSLDIEAVVAPMDEAAGVDYWVYLPPLVSRQASLRQLHELQSRNVDSYIITVGDLSNGISLGIFSRQDSAEGVVSRLRAIDYSASIRELPRSHRRYWAQISRVGKGPLSNTLLSELKRSFPGFEQQQMPCSSIATP